MTEWLDNEYLWCKWVAISNKNIRSDPHSIFEVDYDKEHWANTQIKEVTLSCKEVKNWAVLNDEIINLLVKATPFLLMRSIIDVEVIMAVCY